MSTNPRSLTIFSRREKNTVFALNSVFQRHRFLFSEPLLAFGIWTPQHAQKWIENGPILPIIAPKSLKNQQKS
jgi:hypothetical protein